MSIENFLMFLQQVLTMTDPEDNASRALAKISLESVLAMAEKSGMSDPATLRTMRAALNAFGFLLSNKKDFAGKKGAYLENKAKRQRLMMALTPHC